MKKLIIVSACMVGAVLAFFFLYGPISQRKLQYASLPELVQITDAQVSMKGNWPVIKVTFLNSSDWGIQTVTESGKVEQDGLSPIFYIGKQAFELPDFITQQPAEFTGFLCSFSTPIFKDAARVKAALAAGGALRVEIPVKAWKAQRWQFDSQTYSVDGAPCVILHYPNNAAPHSRVDE